MIDMFQPMRKAIEAEHKKLSRMFPRRIEVLTLPSIGYRIPVNGKIYNPFMKDWPKNGKSVFDIKQDHWNNTPPGFIEP